MPEKKEIQIKKIKDLEKEVEKIFLMKDKGVVRIVCATVIANQMDLDSVWLLLVAPSSGGKTEMISALNKLPMIHAISDLTVNTFASGLQRSTEETSLLFKLNNGIMTFKDFTSVLSKNRDARKEIMGQLREIFDGEYTKETGGGKSIKWRGKVGAIAGATEIVYRHLEEMTAMGDRFIMYNIDQPDRREMSRRMLENAPTIRDQREHLQKCFASYINYIIENISDKPVKISDEIKEELLMTADFATRVRSSVLLDFKTGMIDFVPTKETPARMTNQLYCLAAAFMAMRRAEPHNQGKYDDTLTKEEAKILYKAALDSIPRTRRDALYPMAKYHSVSTVGLANKLKLPTPSARKYLEQLQALGVCDKERKSGQHGDSWILKQEYKDIIIKIKGIKPVDEMLLSTESEFDDDPEASWEKSIKEKKYDPNEELPVENLFSDGR